MKHEEHTQSVLAVIINLFGVVAMVGAMIGAGWILTETKSTWTALNFLYWGLLSALLMFAVGKVIDLLSKTEHHTRVVRHEILQLLRAQLEADSLLQKMADKDEPEEDDEQLKFGGGS